MLKAMGGSGTINPTTGLPEYWGISNIFKPVTQAVKSIQSAIGQTNPFNPGSVAGKVTNAIPGVSMLQNAATSAFQPLEKAVVKPSSAALASFDKAVGNTIPGGWGTIAQTAANFIPVIGPAVSIGLGALNGSGVMHKGRGFNLQGAMLGGAMAYGMSSLSSGLQGAAGSSIPGADIAAANASGDAIGALNASQAWTGAGAQAAADAAAQGVAGASAAGNGFSYTPSGEMVPSNISPDITGAVPNVAPEAASSGIMGTLKEYGQGTLNNAAAAGRGITNLTGMGPEGIAGIGPAADAFKATGATLQNTAVPIAVGGMGLADLEAQAQYLKDQQSSGTITNEEYNTQMAVIDAARTKATEAMQANPYQFGNNTATNAADAIKQNPYQFAMGGSIMDGEAGGDDNYSIGGVPGYALGGMAEGRFLSGGGDGLSDDIPAVIGGKQPAKLADGEFVISSDVVSNLGNGSSKAGAKKLYAMMDRVRQQAHGSKKQISKVNAGKVLPA
jgi:hypothetical protein